MNIGIKLILGICILCITFVAGYLTGNKTNFDYQAPILSNSSALSSNDVWSKSDKHRHNPRHEVNSISTPTSERSRDQSHTDTIIDASQKLISAPSEYDIVTLFNEFVMYSSSDSDYSNYGKKIDEIRKILVSSDADVALLVEYFEELPIDSQASYMLISILMGLPKEISQPAMSNIMQSTLLNDSPNNSANFIELVARTGLKTPEVTSSLKDIAIFGAKHEQTLRALDLLMPYDLSISESQQIKERLFTAVDTSERSERPYYFSQLLRFSSANERKQLALDAFTKTDPNTDIQSIVMDSIQVGTVDRSPELKEALFRIAKQDQSELQKQAIYTLLYRFDLSQEEYRNISSNENIEQDMILDSLH